MIPELKKLGEIRRAENLSLEKIARELGVSVASVRRWLQGHRPIDAMMFQIREFIKRHCNGDNKE